MKLVLDHITVERSAWSLGADGTFSKGIHLVTGAVGSGKSTLALLMAGFLPPVQGTVDCEGINNRMLSTQFPEFHITGLSVSEECASWGLDTDSVLRSAGLDISGDVSAFSLSRGELKRLHLACVLSQQYDLLLLDEPFSSLDCGEKKRLCNELASRDQEIIVIFTHEQSTFPRVDQLWEITGGVLSDLGRVPDAIKRWQYAPALIKRLVGEGRCPSNLTTDKILEAACRTHGYD
jgi:energy-coupling factor transport system ATP-binding protein